MKQFLRTKGQKAQELEETIIKGDEAPFFSNEEDEKTALKIIEPRRNFIIVYESIYKNNDLSALELQLLIKLIAKAPTFKPTLKTLSSIFKIDRRTLIKATKGLQEKGYLKIERNGKASRWLVCQQPILNHFKNEELEKGDFNASHFVGKGEAELIAYVENGILTTAQYFQIKKEQMKAAQEPFIFDEEDEEDRAEAERYRARNENKRKAINEKIAKQKQAKAKAEAEQGEAIKRQAQKEQIEALESRAKALKEKAEILESIGEQTDQEKRKKAITETAKETKAKANRYRAEAERIKAEAKTEKERKESRADSLEAEEKRKR